MSVVNGQIANQTTFNNAFMSRTAATTQTVAKVQLENGDFPDSGAFIGNVQKAINKTFEGVGATGEADTTINDYANQNYIANGDNRKVAIGKLDAQLKSTQDDLDTAEAEIVVHESRLDAHDGTLADHESRLDAAELTITDHETRLDAAELTITDHETRLDAAELTIADHEDRITDLETADMNIGGNKTFTGDVVVQGNFEVQGTLTSINSTNTEVEDQNILVNKNGTDGSSEGAGVDVERPSGNAGLRFDSSLASKFKIGLLSALYEVVVSGVAQTIAGLKDFTSGIKTDTVDESTLDAGVTVDGVLIKDGLVDGRDVGADGTDLDAAELTIADHESRLDAAELTITDHETRLDAAELTITDHETRLDAAELTITDHETRLDAAELTIADHESRLDEIETGNNTFAGTKTFSGDVTFQQTASAQSLVASENLFVGAIANTQTGADQQLTGITAPLVKLTGAGLASVNRIEAPSVSKIIALVNQTGAAVVIKDNAGAPTTDRIRTGTGANIQLENNQIAFLAYDTIAGLWYITSVGGAGGGGSSGKKTFDMKLNGTYGGSAAYNGVDGLWVAPSNCQITNVFIYQEVAGSGGTTNLDLKVKPFAAGSFTSIFLVTPKVTNAAGANAWGGAGDGVSGITSPVLTSLPFAVAAKSAIRMDLLGAQSGGAAGAGLVVVYEEI